MRFSSRPWIEGGGGLREVAGRWWPLALGAVFAIGLGYAGGLLLARLAGVDRTTGVFASVPGGAAETGAIGVHGADAYIPGTTTFSAPGYVALMAATLAGSGIVQWLGVPNAFVTGLHPASVVLGMAPGGIAEMCITAKVLQLGVPLVTAFHVTRVVVLPQPRPGVEERRR